MRRLTCLLLICVATSFATPAVAADAPVKLFDGKSFDGWGYYLADPQAKMDDVWSIKDGILICKGEPMGYLHTKKDYTNFKLTVEWRWPEGKEPSNSGVLMRITGEPKALPKCVEGQLQHGNVGDFWAFQGFKIDGPPARTIKKDHPLGGAVTGVHKTKGNEKKPGEWNTYEITADGDTITLVLNGQQLNQATHCEVLPGKIALQSEGGEVHFRKVELTPIGK